MSGKKTMEDTKNIKEETGMDETKTTATELTDTELNAASGGYEQQKCNDCGKILGGTIEVGIGICEACRMA